MRFQLRVAASALALTAMAVDARAEGDDFVECKGEYAIDGDEAVAKDRAYKQALRDCVERKFGTYVVSATQTKDFQALQDTVLSSAQGFVSEAKELENRAVDGVWTVRLKAKVLQARIDEAAKARHLTLATMKYPRIALIISEQHIVPAGGADQKLAENTIIGEWKAAGPYTFVDLDAAAGKVKGPAFSGEANAETVKQYANVLDADLFVFGSATATRLPGDISSMMNDAQGSLKNMISCRSAISVRAFLPDSGEVVATSDAGKGAVALGELACEKMAVKAAAKVLSADLERKLLSEWNQRVMGSARVRLRVKGIDFSGVKDLKSQLANGFKAISSVTQRSFADGVAEFDLKVDGGDAEALADAFASKGFGKQKLKVTGATSNTITLEAGK